MIDRNIEIPLLVLEKVPYGLGGEEITRWTEEKDKTSLEVEDGKIIIPLKITRIGNEYCREQKWKRADRKFAAYSFETKNINFLDKNQKITVDNLTIVWRDSKNKIDNIDDILSEGTEIKLKLGNDWCLRERGNYKEGGNDIFSLEVYSDYEIITKEKNIVFANSFKKDGDSTKNKNNNSPLNSSSTSKTDKERILRNLTSWSLTDENEFTATSWQFCGGPGSFISLEENEATEVKKAILEMVRKNAQSWRIEEINNFHNPKFFLIHQSVKKLETGFGNEIISNFGKIHNKKGFAEEEWEEVEKIISEGKNNIANPTNNNWTWKEYGLLGAGIAFIIFLLYLIVKKWFL